MGGAPLLHRNDHRYWDDGGMVALENRIGLASCNAPCLPQCSGPMAVRFNDGRNRQSGVVRRRIWSRSGGRNGPVLDPSLAEYRAAVALRDVIAQR